MFQKLIAVGRLGGDAELRHTQAGAAVTNFSVCCTERWKKDGEQHESSEWFRCNLFGKRAEAITPYLTKGTLVVVEGRLKTREYEGKKFIDVSVDDLKFIGEKQQPKQATQQAPQQAQPNTDDIPF
jgi:single-strand DNA-binding protein